MSWAEEELKYTDLGDQRRNQRLVKIVEDLIAQPNASVPQASRDNAAMQGMYDFWANRRIRPLSILEGHSGRTVERCLEHPTVLSIQDTTELDFSAHPSTRGLGAISDPSAIGLKVHLTLCCSDAGVPLGILHETVWAREKTRRGRGYRGYGNYPDEMSVSMPQTFVKYTFQFLLHFVVYGVLARGIETT